MRFPAPSANGGEPQPEPQPEPQLEPHRTRQRSGTGRRRRRVGPAQRVGKRGSWMGRSAGGRSQEEEEEMVVETFNRDSCVMRKDGTQSLTV